MALKTAGANFVATASLVAFTAAVTSPANAETYKLVDPTTKASIVVECDTDPRTLRPALVMQHCKNVEALNVKLPPANVFSIEFHSIGLE